MQCWFVISTVRPSLSLLVLFVQWSKQQQLQHQLWFLSLPLVAAPISVSNTWLRHGHTNTPETAAPCPWEVKVAKLMFNEEVNFFSGKRDTSLPMIGFIAVRQKKKNEIESFFKFEADHCIYIHASHFRNIFLKRKYSGQHLPLTEQTFTIYMPRNLLNKCHINLPYI